MGVLAADELDPTQRLDLQVRAGHPCMLRDFQPEPYRYCAGRGFW